MDTIDFLLHDVHTMILFSCLKCVAVMSLCHSCYLNVFFLFIKKEWIVIVWVWHVMTKHLSKTYMLPAIVVNSCLLIKKTLWNQFISIWVLSDEGIHIANTWLYLVTSLKSQTRCYLFRDLVALRCKIKIIKHTKCVLFSSWHLLRTTRKIKIKKNVSL